MSNYAIIVAGGRGKRMQCEGNKCLMMLLGKPLVAWTLEAFQKSGVINGIVCVMGDEEEVTAMQEICAQYELDPVHPLITEGPHRQDGVQSGLTALQQFSPQDEDLVLVHNGANPLVQTDDILASIEAAQQHGASVCAHRVRDTIKRADENLFVLETIARESLWAMQTPQTMRYGLAVQAFDRARAEGFYGTDDVQLVERIGGQVKIVGCSFANRKITSPEDLHAAEQLLKERLK